MSATEKVAHYSRPSADCIIWFGPETKAGRLFVTVDGRRIGARRLALELSSGRKVEEGRIVQSICEHPNCIKPDHLFAFSREPSDADKAEILRLRSAADPVTGCVEWTWSGVPAGYGTFSIGGKKVFAHRVALELKLGRSLHPGMMACHDCNNPKCVNAEHLREDTNRGNIADAVRLDRVAFGERHPQAKLTDAKVRAILLDDRSAQKIADQYGVNPGTIRPIKNRRTWRRVSAGLAA